MWSFEELALEVGLSGDPSNISDNESDVDVESLLLPFPNFIKGWEWLPDGLLEMPP